MLVMLDSQCSKAMRELQANLAFSQTAHTNNDDTILDGAQFCTCPCSQLLLQLSEDILASREQSIDRAINSPMLVALVGPLGP